MQVNEALYTCTSWYVYAAMFGSSTVAHVAHGYEQRMLSSHIPL